MIKKIKRLGIYMDHSQAFLMEIENAMIISRNIVSGWKLAREKDKEDGCFTYFNCSEKKFLQKAYNKEISNVIKNYQQVVLFGPTEAKNELNNLLIDNHLFDDVQIEIVATDKMTNAEKHEFVFDYFKISNTTFATR